jgi:hypothetical protein
MATENKAPTKAEILEALSKKGINTLEELVDTIMPETGGFGSGMPERVGDFDTWQNDPLSFLTTQYAGTANYTDTIT